ncbi:MAG TPA: hypothetical protein EYG67_03010 [Campylobacterales bacterium]|nr:hypothetical protein [Campylobacterales bacterium]HIP41986.1 hypothetical protein [Campylobacterales bacterium]
MINTKQLEKRWYRYKTKNFILFFAGFLLFLLLPYGGYYLLNYGNPMEEKNSLNTPVVQMDSTSIKEVKLEEKPIVETISVAKEHNLTPITPSEVILSPVIPIVDFTQEKSNDRANKRVVEKKSVSPKRKEKSRLVQAKPSTYLTPNELSVVNGTAPNRETKKIHFQSSSSNYMEIMKQKFHENKNPREAMLLANAYYKAGNYIHSEKWALKANSLDKDLEESWLLFAKSKKQQGSRNEAVKILETYYKKSKSTKAKMLIQKIHSEGLQ